MLAVCVATGFAAFGGCSGGDDATPSRGPVVSDATTAETTGSWSPSSPSAPSPASTADEKFDRASPPASTASDQADELASAVTAMTRGRLALVAPDADCVEAATAELPARGRRALAALIDDPFGGRTADPAAVEQVLAALLGCMEPDSLRMAVVLSVLKMNEVGCVVDAWRPFLTADSVAASLAHGDLLDDLPADVVDAMASAAAACGPDRRWWIDDVIFRDELQLDLPDHELECIAARYVDVIGVEEVIRRRVLDAPLLALPPELEARLDLSGQCDVDESGRFDLFVAGVGACVTGARDGTAVAAVTACDQPHDAEVFAVHDIAADHPTWPGVRAIIDTAEARCTADPDAIAGDPGNHSFLWIHPLRRTWEQGDRTVLCLIVHEGEGEWDAPSGLVPSATVPSTTTAAPTTTSAPSGTRVPVGAREMFSLDEVDRVGMCVYRAPALPGQADLDRRFFDVDCSAPHQAEMYHRFTIERAPGSPYPGDETIQAQADPVCELTFAAYVGLPYESSRLRFVYFYPSAETWDDGDRSVVCFLVGTEVDEVFTRSMSGSRE
jgi:hypothetical protein